IVLYGPSSVLILKLSNKIIGFHFFNYFIKVFLNKKCLGTKNNNNNNNNNNKSAFSSKSKHNTE
ncbi:MAG: hypothetical protein N7Q72_03195, partial [Spiroplasma sp. Tabriz.8]|nr:hypothetical protein [Serratia symbiotica]MCZ8632250.1 hypothetical protein [Spiroplasma sp. Tabriz.8]